MVVSSIIQGECFVLSCWLRSVRFGILLAARLRLTTVHFYTWAVKWSFVDWNTLLETEPHTHTAQREGCHRCFPHSERRVALRFKVGYSEPLFEEPVQISAVTFVH